MGGVTGKALLLLEQVFQPVCHAVERPRKGTEFRGALVLFGPG